MRKDRFGDVMRRWCTRHGFIQKMNDGKEIMTKLPYRICKGGSCVECAKDFIELANKNLLNLAIEN